MSKNIRHKRGTDWSKVNTSRLEDIVNHPHHQGIDGVDYAPYIEELNNELWKRYASQALASQKRMEIEAKQYERHLIEAAKEVNRNIRLAKKTAKQNKGI